MILSVLYTYITSISIFIIIIIYCLHYFKYLRLPFKKAICLEPSHEDIFHSDHGYLDIPGNSGSIVALFTPLLIETEDIMTIQYGTNL